MNKIFREGFFDFGSGGANPESEPLSEKNITRIANEISDEVMKIVQRHLEGYKAPEPTATEKMEPSEPARRHLNVKSIVCLHVDAAIARVSELNLPRWTAEMNETVREGVLRAYDKGFARDGRPYFPQKEYFLQPAGEGEPLKHEMALRRRYEQIKKESAGQAIEIADLKQQLEDALSTVRWWMHEHGKVATEIAALKAVPSDSNINKSDTK